MGKYVQVSKLNDEQFRRLTGVKLETFKVMIEVAEQEIRQRGVKPNIGTKRDIGFKFHSSDASELTEQDY